jgi:ribose 5-phosphate isomerase B
MTKSPAVKRVAVGADHGGFKLKAQVLAWLRAMGLEVADLGTHSEDPCDYPKIAAKVAQAVSSGEFDRGILACRSGIGMAMAANKIAGIRAGVCADVNDAQRSREHNDANVLALGADKLSARKAKQIVKTWIETPFDAQSRHGRRVQQIKALEAGQDDEESVSR